MKDGKHVILCIDDDQDFLDAVIPIVESADYEVVSATSAEDGLRLYKEQNPDLVLIDLMMEEVDAGTNFVKEVRAIGTPPPILMLSSVGDNLSLSTSYTELGLAGVLQKPVDPRRLLSTLKAKLA